MHRLMIRFLHRLITCFTRNSVPAPTHKLDEWMFTQKLEYIEPEDMRLSLSLLLAFLFATLPVMVKTLLLA